MSTDVHAMTHGGKPQGGAHERTQTLLGSVCPDDAAWFHDLCLVCEEFWPESTGFEVDPTVKSLYAIVNPLRE